MGFFSIVKTKIIISYTGDFDTGLFF